jgi:hypothetical protein
MKIRLRTGILILVFGPFLLLTTSSHAMPIIDDLGDTFGVGLFDIASMDIQYDATNLYIATTFTGPVSESGAGNPFDLYGYIDLDVDQNPGTGVQANTDIWGGASGIGMDYFLNIADGLPDGQIQLVDSAFTVIGNVPIIFGANSFSSTVPLALLGADDGLVDYAAIFGGIGGPDDFIPNQGFGTSQPVPEPATVLLLGTGLVGLVGFRKKFKK